MSLPIYPSTSTFNIPAINSNYRSYLTAVVGGSTWFCTTGANPILATNQPAPSTSLISSTRLVSMATIFQKVYIVDGSSTIFQANPSTLAMETYSTTAGTHPTFCNLACNWRSRLILAGDINSPHLFYCARLGTPTDWDYSQTDPASAFAGNLSIAGQIGEPIIALIPYSDDYLVVGCAHSMWMLSGDPADGGSIVRISDSIGIIGPRAWAIDPVGTLYFVGSGGLYRLRPAWEKLEPAKNLSASTMNRFFDALSWNYQSIQLVYDSDLHYLYVFVTPTSSTSTGTHMVYDARYGGFWPQGYPRLVGPTSAVAFEGQNDPNSRAIIVGGWDGYLRVMDQGAFDDDSSTVSSYLVFGPLHPIPMQSILTAATVNFGDLFLGDASSTWNANLSLYGGPNAFTVTEGTPRNSTFINYSMDQRQKTARQRLRGEWFTVKIHNSTNNAYFSFESALLEFEPAGRNRERR